jgi:hypothetical protein
MGLKKLAKTIGKKKTVAKGKTAAKGKTTAAKKGAAKKPEKRKKAIGFEIDAEYKTAIEESFEALQEHFEAVTDPLGTFLEGIKKDAAIARGHLMELIKEAKTLRGHIQDAKTNLTPIYKE